LWREPGMSDRGGLDVQRSSRDTATRSVELANAVVVIGGRHGTERMLDQARKLDKPIYHIPGTGGAAEKAMSAGGRDRSVSEAILSRSEARHVVLHAFASMPPPDYSRSRAR